MDPLESVALRILLAWNPNAAVPLKHPLEKALMGEFALAMTLAFQQRVRQIELILYYK